MKPNLSFYLIKNKSEEFFNLSKANKKRRKFENLIKTFS